MNPEEKLMISSSTNSWTSVSWNINSWSNLDFLSNLVFSHEDSQDPAFLYVNVKPIISESRSWSRPTVDSGEKETTKRETNDRPLINNEIDHEMFIKQSINVLSSSYLLDSTD